MILMIQKLKEERLIGVNGEDFSWLIVPLKNDILYMRLLVRLCPTSCLCACLCIYI